MNEALRTVYKALDDKFGRNIVVLDIREVSIVADYFVIATGGNPSQIKAMADEVMEKMHKNGKRARHSEGYGTAQWILLDFEDIIVHIFDEESRGFYNLERVWGDARTVEI